MSRFIVLLFGVLALTSPVAKNAHRYVSPDGTTRVSVIPVGKRGPAQSESLIEFRTAEGRLLCGLNYSSSDGEHGFGVVKAAWTEDSRYFVFSLTSSGGHQSWHAPTQFYSSKTGAIRTLDDYLDGAGITQPNFELLPPNIVATTIREYKDVPVSVHLDSIFKRSPKRNRPFSVHCAGGHIVHIDEP
ncbi:MAG TPA: hypothetical protein VN745_10790 [Verrucomicrobiae bacterium]|nr:hypothetical protein [Verrucomicrobiae bacterium]